MPADAVGLHEIWSRALDDFYRLTELNLRDSGHAVIARRLAQCSTTMEMLDTLQDVSRDFRLWRKGGKMSQKIRESVKPVVYGLRTILDAVSETASASVCISAGFPYLNGRTEGRHLQGAPGGKGIFAALVLFLKVGSMPTGMHAR